MKNPQSVPAPVWVLDALARADRRRQLVATAAAAPPALSTGSAPRVLNLMSPVGLGVLDRKDDKKDDPSALAGVLQYLKYTPDQIERIERFVGYIGKVAAAVSWVVSSITTVKDLLTFVGVLDADKAAQAELDSIKKTVDTIYDYLEETDRKLHYDNATTWRDAIQAARNAISNLSLARTEENLTSLWDKTSELMGHINFMLDAGTPNIAFQRKTYGGHPSGYVYQNELPTHWVEYAMPFWMETTGGQPVTNELAQDLGSRIWDPGYYIDVLFEAVGMRVAALSALEPAFRSTGQDREDLRTIYNGLDTFVDTWSKSLFKTKVVGPLDPSVDVYGYHRIYHPWITPEAAGLAPSTSWADPPGLPLGVVDPVSGIAAFDPVWRDGLDLLYLNVAGYWVVTNYDAAVKAAHDRLQQQLQDVKDACGLNRLATLRDALFDLIVPPFRSEFVTIGPAGFTRRVSLLGVGGVSESPTPEQVDLGIIGSFAGKPGKTYNATRFYQTLTKTIRIPMARRMDRSRIQIGYRLNTFVGHAPRISNEPAPIDVNTDLTKWGYSNDPLNTIEFFPSTPITFDLSSDKACIYDVLQSAVFSESEEVLFEEKGAVPKKDRLFVNPRDGSVDARVSITFEYDATNIDKEFVGYALVRVSVANPDSAPGGFILSLTVYETKSIGHLDRTQDSVQETFADSVTLHVAPTFLVVEPDYFTDRAEGLKAMGQAFEKVSRRFSESKPQLGPGEPVEWIERVARYEQALVDAYQAEARRSPEEMQQIESTYVVPFSRAQFPG